MVEKVATKIQETFIPECSVNQDIDEHDSTMIVFTTQVESVEKSLIKFDDEKTNVELIQPDDVNNRVDVIMVGLHFYFIVHVKFNEYYYLPYINLIGAQYHEILARGKQLNSHRR